MGQQRRTFDVFRRIEDRETAIPEALVGNFECCLTQLSRAFLTLFCCAVPSAIVDSLSPQPRSLLSASTMMASPFFFWGFRAGPSAEQESGRNQQTKRVFQRILHPA